MKKSIVVSAVACLLVAQSAFAVSAVRLSQVYGGGGSSSTAATYNQDYTEIFNSSGVAVDISNWTIEYGSATGSWGSSSANIFTFPQGTSIPGCSYILVAHGTPSTGGAALPITPDFTGTLTIAATSGKVALFNAVNTNLACGSELPGTLVDKVAFGTSNCAEGTATAALTNATGAVRNGGGSVDTDDNAADFTVTANPVPHNLASGTSPGCVVIAVEEQTWSRVKTLFQN